MSIEKFSTLHPYLSRIKDRFLLNNASSTKKTYHIAITIDAASFPFHPGDSIGILVQNDPQEVDAILKHIGKTGQEEILHPKLHTPVSLWDFLLRSANLSRVNSSFLKQLIGAENELFLPENKEKLTTFLHTHSVLDLLHLKQKPLYGDRFDLSKLMPLLPRFYSIANSSLVFPGEIHLAVAYLSYIAHGQIRKGVASRFLCDLAEIGTTPIPIYLQPTHHFRLPQDPNASIILIGPGTGIAPFRAFLQQRLATGSTGRNWLFFGERNRTFDFYYQDFWLSLEQEGHLRLDLAFSRDTQEKIYVQHRLYEQRKSIWSWLQDGAYFYVCGDAENMAKAVEATMLQIIREEGGLKEDEARAYLRELRQAKRYLTDVY